MENVLECSNLTKRYGKKVALDNLNFTLPKGRIVGLLGPNGAGKTTLMKLIVSLLRDYRGSITVCGRRPGLDTKKIVSYLPDREFLYPWMTIEECIAFFRNSFADFQLDMAYAMIEELGLDPKEKVKNLSKGMQERVSISLVFARKAKLYVLDEPLAAVDPSTRDKIMRIILEHFDPESSILLSTHLIHDVESLFTDIAIVNEGRVQLYGGIGELQRDYGMPIEEIFKQLVG
ncbi:multidrug ABC transporter ATP-binding protein [Paenibacillus riograndensis]|uniref:Multidrug ABC transporter ATP-binding protein n=1 Tax=Paenibacillus riograndensis TaxID=483937 RepID=A0A132U422_9BACL|nr:ABC transporter ATP-binding protein [Paenibacillus riograndensis]KWX78319.1 multidrug ABC transporter ATP-binding protein [Paenibacillus riograndensis]